MRVFILALIITNIYATNIPDYVLAGIMMQESHSYYKNNEIVYVDKKVGLNGELSAFQIKYVAWLQVFKPGERFSDLAEDQTYAEDIACRYLAWLYNHSAKRDWRYAIQYYNGGPYHRSYHYYANVVYKAKKLGYATP